MSGLACTENFEIYGGDIDKMLQGRISERGSPFGVGLPDTLLEIPSWETQGRYWLMCRDRGAGIRYGFGSNLSAVGMWMEFRLPYLPPLDNRAWLAQLRDATNAVVLTLRVTTDGNITVHNSAGTQIAATTAPCISAGVTHKLQFQTELAAGTGTLELRVDGSVRINATGLSNAGTTSQVFHGINDTAAGPHALIYYKAIATYTLTGTYNSSFPAITGVATLMPNADNAVAGWTPFPIQKIGTGVLQVGGNGAAIDAGALSAYDVGTGDFTFETWVRFAALPTALKRYTIAAKGTLGSNNMSWLLSYLGPSYGTGPVRFECTTDGTGGTLVAVQDLKWTPNIGQWYHLAVCRASGVNRVFVDGVQLGVDVTDTTNYYASGTTAKLALGGEILGTGTSVATDSSLVGHLDGTRYTVGVGRYTANFTPPNTAYPTTVGGDPSYNSVQVLAQYEGSLADQSPTPKTLTAIGAASVIAPADGTYEYQALNALLPLDDRYLAASLVAATGIFTVTANPANGETVTVGGKTYTFNTVLGGANSILIGANFAATLSNLTAAINGGAGIGTLYGTGTTANANVTAVTGPSTAQMTVEAITAGTAGNSIASTDTSAVGSWSGSTLAGGANIPGASQFGIGPLSPSVTGVRWLVVIDRSFVDTGTATIQKSFFVNSSSTAFTATALSTTPAYRAAVIEEDPSSSAALTPASILASRVQLNRTA